MDTRDALIDATAQLLWERGYNATSPAMIQKRAHAGQGSMYHHFNGKADLAETAMLRVADTMRTAARAALAGEGSAVERVYAYLDLDREPLRGCRLGRLAQDPDVVDDAVLRAPVEALFTGLEDDIAAVLRDGVRTGELRPDADPEATAALVVAVVQGGYVLARARQDPEAFARAMRGARQAVAALAAPNTPGTKAGGRKAGGRKADRANADQGETT